MKVTFNTDTEIVNNIKEGLKQTGGTAFVKLSLLGVAS